MRIEPMDHTTTEVTIENQGDLWSVKRGLIDKEAVRFLHLPVAIVDPKSDFLSLPTSLYKSLGLSRLAPARITILGRTCTMDVQETPDSSPVKIGRPVLLSLDLVIDPELRTLVGNPAHGGEWVIESYFQASEFASPTTQSAPLLTEPIA